MKISTKIMSSAAVALMAIGTSAPVFAADAATTSTATSNGKITLETDPDQSHPGNGDDGGDGKDPSNPSDPNHPGDGNGNDNTGNKGAFTLDVVPNYDFGTQKADGTQHIYPALYYDATKGALDTGRNANPLTQVTDVREKNSGWNLSVAMTKAFTTSDGTKTIDGAILDLPQGTAAPSDASNKSTAPTTNEIKEVNSSNQIIMSAKANEGVGTWQDKMFNDATNNTQPTNLTVPASASAGTYTAELTWTLADTPNA